MQTLIVKNGGICIDGIRAITGKKIGFKSYFQAAHSDHIIFIHQEVLAAK